MERHFDTLEEMGVSTVAKSPSRAAVNHCGLPRWRRLYGLTAVLADCGSTCSAFAT